ncbi:UDP-N-acetylglucosamine--N-acetylmuramyl-(pentapeptide) pyrophosphoryl-undecaprenol N-acetylglucosamine transferase [Salinibacillus kushneri]|uniref:UDP-N-acetylglucosamine--N-acetylmuramyl-(pentapeptide) pyrophosphoryl-undecaprenol N-acetylglucosamine transferase n=1 Tax=Salinibacillus kushneri TaxID=237682 RepID=A0A1I0ANM7_9BACI|nr:undecaprenyldiphospho-muramoylpentapeptide beta-N-acetylglucosaminyltransferase [Salinibacillus kushneri]SES95983.1 UDP-N-acetylglucosamine--N-acetylmuramyl-(pentapeptide) pyrophosphoryl-undecaprenol N-acetylglucosamine transferase [Salinibacillus kushneri]
MKRKNKSIVFTGGGTAGHVVVNLALIPEFLHEGWDVHYIGSHQGIERELVSGIEEITYHSISTGKLRRYFDKENFKDPFRVLKGTFQSLRILSKVKPHAVFSKGGFVSVPVVTAAKLKGVPAIIHESDYTPGLANKMAFPFAKKVLATFPETMEYLPVKKAEWVGAIIREELFQGDKMKGLKQCEFVKDKPVVLIMGGSSGSQKMNDIIRKHLDQLLDAFQIIHICGKGKVDSSINRFGYVQFEYVQDELKDLIAAADLVVSRAGSNSIYEFLALHKPMLLIPLSKQASRGDQILNANSFKKQGFARVIEEEELQEERFLNELNQLWAERKTIMEKMEAYKSEETKDQVIQLIKHIKD